MSCEVLHYQYDIPVDVEFSVLGVILMAATNYQINECRFELLLRQHFLRESSNFNAYFKRQSQVVCLTTRVVLAFGEMYRHIVLFNDS